MRRAWHAKSWLPGGSAGFERTSALPPRAGKAVKFFLSQGCEALMVQETRVLPDDKAACEQAMR